MRRGERSGPTRFEVALLILVLIGMVGALIYRWESLSQFVVWVLDGDQEQIREWAASLGPRGPLVTIALNVAQVLLAPIPGQFVGIANGYLYGVWLGTLYSTVGLLIGTTATLQPAFLDDGLLRGTLRAWPNRLKPSRRTCVGTSSPS